MDSLQRVSINSGSVWGESKYSRPGAIELDDAREHACLYVDLSLYPLGARFVKDFKRSNPESRHTMRLLQLFCAVLVDMRETQRKRLMKKKKKKKKTEDDDVDASEEARSSYSEGNIRGYVETVCEMRGLPLGYRFHIVTLGGSSNHIAESLNDVLQSNVRDAATRRSGIGRVSKIAEFEEYRRIASLEEYARSCDLYTRSDACSDEMDAVHNVLLGLESAANPANPLQVFSLENCFRYSRGKPGVSPLVLSHLEYFPDGELTGEAGYTFRIPFPTQCVRLTDTQFAPHIFFPMYIPHYQFVEYRRLVEDMRSTLQRTLQQRSAAGAGYDAVALMHSHLETMMDDPAMRIWHLDPVRRLRKDAETTDDGALMREFYGRVWDEDAPISNAGKRIFAWWRTARHRHVAHELWAPDGLTVFAHWVTRLYSQINYHGVVSTAHATIFKVLIGVLDAYRCDMGLHLNGLCTGNSSTGKSFMFDLVKSLCIPGTITEVTRKTACADAVEPENPGAFSDRIVFLHEMPGGMIKEGLRENDQAAEMKSALTSGVVTTEFFFQEEDGTRRKRTIENLVIGTNWGATNTGARGIGEAMLSRFMHFPMDIKDNKRRSIAACKQAERTKTARDRQRDEDFAYECMWRQAAVWIVEKLIHAGNGKLLPEVNMYAAVQNFDRLMKGVAKERGSSGTRVHPRNVERMMIYARLFTIINAIEHVFCVPHAPHSTCDACIDDFLDLAPYLVCTEEIAIFTFTMLKDQFFERSNLLPLVKTIWAETGGFQQNATQRSAFSAVQAAAEINYNYIHVPMPLKQLAKRVHLTMSEETGKSSTIDIEVTLNKLTSQAMKIKTWSEHAQDGPMKTLPKAVFEYKHCYFLRGQSERDDEQWMRAVQHARHKYTEPQTIITAINPPDAPAHVLQTMRWGPRGNQELTVDNYLSVSPAEEAVLGFSTGREQTTTIKRSFEAIAFQQAQQPRIKRARVSAP